MPRLRVHAFAISIDGYGAGPEQSRDNPLGRGGTSLHQWMYPTRTFQRMFGKDEGTTGIDDDLAGRGFDNTGAWILGRNMFGPVRGPASGHDVRVGGGVATIQQYLNARLIDDVHLAISPVLLGGGEPLFAGFDLPGLGYEVTEHIPSEKATYVIFSRRG